MRALMVEPQPFFSPRGSPLQVYYRVQVLAELGVKVDLLTYGEGQDVDLPGVRMIRIPRFASLGHVKTGPSLLKAFLDVFLALWTIGLLLRHRYDFVHAHEEAVFFCRFLKPLFRFKLVYEMHSQLPEQLRNFDFTTSRALIWAFERLEATALHAADAVITICPALADYATGVLAQPDKHVLIENSLFEPVKLAGTAGDGASPPAGANGDAGVDLPAGRPLIVYAGTLEAYQGIELLLRAFRLLRADEPAAFLLVAGGTADHVEHYRALAADLKLRDDCVFTGRVPPAVAKAFCARADVQVSARIEGMNTPLKVYEQLASGVPLVATDIYAHTQVLDDAVAFLVQPTPEAFSAGLAAALGDAPAAARKVDAAKRLYDQKYARHAYVAKMEEFLGKLA